MLRFLFWNIGKRDLHTYVARAAQQKNADMLVLAECADPIQVLRELHGVGLTTFNHHRNPVTTPIEVFSCLPLDRVTSLGDYGGLTFRKVIPPIGKEVLLVGAHLPSKLYMTEDDQALHCPRFAAKIAEFELRVGHKRTVLVGDLNMNPFEKGVVAANGFHATSSKVVAKKGTRVVQGERYTFFYNPMWSRLGDRGNRPPGTYFYNRSQLTEYFWHVFDQVLIRPDLVEEFDDSSLEVISEIGGGTLLDANGRPNGEELSDHLPIVFSLK